MTSCPDDDALVAVVEHALAPDAMAAIEAHVDACARCRATIGHLAAIDESDGPRHVGRYRLERLLGQGGMGVVWQAFDPMLERGVAIKLLRGDGSAGGSARMLREARALAKLQHPNVVAVHDVGELDGEVFIATELIDGEPMHRWQHERGAMEIVAAYAQAARGLAAAHALGLVHRDVKPSNILVARDGRVRVGDFGLVTSYEGATLGDGDDAPLTAAGDIVGTPAYMAPEQRAGLAADARSDQFSLCLSLAEALIGARPPPDASAESMAAAIAAPAPWAAIARGLARDPSRRFDGMTALAAALEAGGDPPKKEVRTRWIIGAAIAGAAIVAASAGVLGGSPAPAPPHPTARQANTLIAAATRAAEDHDAAACFAAVAQLDALGVDVRMQRGVCEMIAGRCDRGTAQIAAFLDDAGAPATGAAVYVRLWCPIEGDLATRLERASTQAVAHEHLAYCESIAAPVRAVAAEVATITRDRYDDRSNMQRNDAANALYNLGRCHSLAHRCDQAAAFWAESTALRGIDVGHAPCR